MSDLRGSGRPDEPDGDQTPGSGDQAASADRIELADSGPDRLAVAGDDTLIPGSTAPIGGRSMGDSPPSGFGADEDGASPASAGVRSHPPSGLAVFALDGRAAPGLYALGWAGTIGGVALLVVAIGGGPSGAAGTILALAATVLLGIGLVAASGAQGMQRQADERPEYRGPSPFLVFLATLPVSIMVIAVVLGSAAALGLDPGSPFASLVQLAITAIVNIGLVRLLVVSPGALSWPEMGLRRQALRLRLADIGAGALLAVPVVLVTALLAGVLVSLLGTQPDSPLPPSTSNADVLINLIAAAIVAPIGEEVLYRGLATTAWARGMGARRGIVRGALFFAFVHVLTISGTTFAEAAPQAFISFAIRLPVALALGWVFISRRSLPASIGLHATFNGLLLILGQLATK